MHEITSSRAMKKIQVEKIGYLIKKNMQHYILGLWDSQNCVPMRMGWTMYVIGKEA